MNHSEISQAVGNDMHPNSVAHGLCHLEVVGLNVLNTSGIGRNCFAYFIVLLDDSFKTLSSI